MKNVIGLLGLVSGVVFFAQAAHAETTNLNSVVLFDSGVTLGNEQNLDFSTINYSGVPGAGDTVALAPDGTIIYAGIFSGSGLGTAGSVDVTAGNNGQVIEVFCDATATLSDGAGGTIDATIEVAPEDALGTPQPCNGVGGAAAHSFTLNVGVLDTFVFGGMLDGSTAAGFSGGNYSTSNAGGDNVQVDVFYQ